MNQELKVFIEKMKEEGLSKSKMIVKLYEEKKLTINEIAEVLGLSYQRVYNTLVVKGLYRPGQTPRAPRRGGGGWFKKMDADALLKKKKELREDLKKTFIEGNKKMYRILLERYTKVHNKLLDKLIEEGRTIEEIVQMVREEIEKQITK